MITKENYSKATMADLTGGLPRGTKNAIALKLNIPYTTVDNVWNGKSYNEKVIRAIIRFSNKKTTVSA